MQAEEIISYCLENFEGTVLVNSWGEKGIFYNPDNKLKRGIYVLTIKEKGGENDKASSLDREGIFRINIGIRKNTFLKFFDSVPKRPEKGGVVKMDYDFTITNKILPHPVYAWMSWICVLNPTKQTFEKLKPLIKEAYEYAKEKFLKKK